MVKGRRLPGVHQGAHTDQLWGLTPFSQPCASLVVALTRAGAFGVLDVGTAPEPARAALAQLAGAPGIGPNAPFGIRVGDADVVAAERLPPAVSTVVIGAGSQVTVERIAHWRQWGLRVVVEATSYQDAERAVAAGAAGLVAKGAESGGRVGDVGAFVLLQQLAGTLEVPVWCQGGMGRHSAAGAIAGGAVGVVLDAQLALVKEMRLPSLVREAVASMDGGETVVAGGHRVFARPDVAIPPPNPDPADMAGRLGVDLPEALLPAGQDAALAADLARRFHTAGGVVHAVREAIGAQLQGAAAGNILGPGSAFAEAFGLRYPIAQGPMTRVSDRPQFAAAVAREGGLPFLALALMEPDAARVVLRETQAAVAGRTWGVGVLGFVPPELRAGQLAAVLEVGPTVALIAGGRPSLARPLEDAGIATFLHVPSPGLLELFVREGARRFVFEGRECGGHVGPRSSFVLWEQQISQLLAGDVEGMDILFAGGIHDARSAAMVAAMAAPLAAGGARIGVLMGTAYLFTDEAVATGAIRAPFREAAIACLRTALLETAPGHTTRCAETTFVGRFNEERRALEAAGLSGPDRWAALEDLNLGRLRIAAKGVRRDGGQMVEVDEEGQRRDGLYMIGDVATLRHEATTIAALHQATSAGSEAVLRAVAPRPAMTPDPVDVAVIGMACLFPGAGDAAQYWTNIVAGTTHVRPVSADRWDPAIHCSAQAIGPKGTVSPSRWGGFLEPTPFNPMKYGIPPASLGAIEPVQLLSLEVAATALADAGYADREFDRARTSVVFGVEGASDLSSAYVFRALAPSFLGTMPEALDEHLPALTEDSFPGVLSNVIAGRIANRLDLGGANFSVDAACAASLAALHLACQDLGTGGSDMVLCGGADLHNGIYDYQLFASVGALSPTGACKSFDASADGIALGEGVACLVLKRLADATRDGDRIYAVIKGIGASSDGRSLGLTAPRGEGQRVALERAFGRAGVAAGTVGLVEAHGTGTVVGDRTELSTLTEFFTASGSQPGSCDLGSVKAQIGHTKCAAGMAGLIKACLALHHAVRPPSAHIRRPSAAHDRATSPFAFSATARPWPASHRRAGVSAFGFGGSNFHVVLDSYDDDGGPAHGLDQWPAELFLFEGDQAAELEHRLSQHPGARLRDLAADHWSRRAGSRQPGMAIVATSLDDLRAKLEGARSGSAGPGVYRAGERSRPAGVAFLFPGQGSQRPAMLADLFVAFPALHSLLRLGARYQAAMFPATSHDPEQTAAQRAAITETVMAQPTLGLAGLGVARLLQELGVVPDALGGHSYGEMVALAAAGAFAPSDLMRLSERRAQVMARSTTGIPGAMAAVAASADEVVPVLGRWPSLVLANDNGPRQVVISGPRDDVAAASEWLSGQGLATRALPVSCAFHSPLMGLAAAQFADSFGDLALSSPAVPVWSNHTATPYPDDPAMVKALLSRQVDHPVRFREQVESMYDAGIGTFIEAGPGRVLTGLVGQILGDRPHRALPVDAPGVPGLEQLLHTLAVLGVNGTELALAPLFEGRDVAPLGARTSPVGAWMIDGQLVRGPDGNPVPGGLRPSTEITPLALAPTSPAPAEARPSVPQGITASFAEVPLTELPLVGGALAGGSVEHDPVMLEYLRGLSLMVTAGHDTMTRYFQSRGGVPPVVATASARAALPFPPVEPVSSTPAPPLPPDGPPAPAVAAPPATAAPPAQATPRSREELLAAIVAVVSERTGYPVEMLGADLDLEADLSIDSIKRIEIVGDLVVRVGLGGEGGDGGAGVDDAMVEQLTVLKSLAQIVDWIVAHTGTADSLAVARRADPLATAKECAPAVPPAAVPPAAVSSAPGPASARAGRFVQRVEPAGAAGGPVESLLGRRFLLTDDEGGIAPALTRLLESRGAQVTVDALGADWSADTFVHLASLSPQGATPSALLTALAPHLGAGLRMVLVATGTGGSFGRDGAQPFGSSPVPAGAGLRGMAKSLAREYPDLRVRAVDLAPGGDASVAAGQLLAELSTADPLLEVGYRAGRRLRLRTVPAPLEQDGSAGIRPGRGDVVLVTGGGRGITAAVAVALAQQGCHLELVGRTPLLHGLEDDATAACADERALRHHVASRPGPGRGPAEIEAECARIIAQRQLGATLAAIASAGGSATYHDLDVRDGAAVVGLVEDIYRRHGTIAGMVHGAGVVEDRLAADKTAESFARVYDTKVVGARALLAAARPGLRFTVLFGSVSGAFGNRGQVDYAAANEALEAMAWAHNGGPAGRVVCIHWGPWGGGGMVSPSLEREFARRGVGLIDPEEGASCVLRELALGRPSAACVVVMRAQPDDLGVVAASPLVRPQLAGTPSR